MNPAGDIEVMQAPMAGSPGLAGRLFAHRAFLVAMVVLAMAAGGLNFAVSHLQLHFKKEPVPMRAPKFATMPQIIGNRWVMVARDENLDPNTLHALGTEEFLFCNYIDFSKLYNSNMTTPQELLKEFEGKSLKEQRAEIDALLKTYNQPSAVLSVGLTYYTGKADTVAHVPERCYVGGGFEPESPQTLEFDLTSRKIKLPVRYIPFTPPNAQSHVANVAYVFHVNGTFESDSLAVRKKLQNLFARYGYYAKVELMCATADNEQQKDEARRAMAEFLDLALPHIEAALPDWTQYQSRK